MTWGYGTLATEVYDLDKPIGSSFGDVEFYRGLLAGMDGRVLEPTVGTGRILIPLMEAGLTVDGSDTSPQMLAICRERCSERGLEPDLFEVDMTAFVAAERYGAVIVPTGSISLLNGSDALTRALASFHASLRVGGRLIIDLGPPELLASAEPLRTWRVDATVWTLQTMHVAYDSVANQTTRWLRYEKWSDGALLATELQIFRLQHWSIAEFTGLLAEAGFTRITVTADYSAEAQPGPGSDIWTFSAVRSGGV